MSEYAIKDGKEYYVGDTIKVLNGIDKDKIGKILKFYFTDGIVSVSVKWGEAHYGMYQLSDIEKV